MVYVFDTNALITLFMNYYHSRFPSLWDQFDLLVGEGQITSVREVEREIVTTAKTGSLSGLRPTEIYSRNQRKMRCSS